MGGARLSATRRYVYWWADGIYVKVRLTDERPYLLAIVGTLADGTKELVAIADGERESTLSWRELLRDLKRRGVAETPALCVGDGALGLWAALMELAGNYLSGARRTRRRP